MFYVNGFAKIEKDNVTTKCPGCGRMHHVDLAELAATARENFSLEDTRVYCEDCTAKRQKESEK